MDYPTWNLTKIIIILLGLHPFSDHRPKQGRPKIHVIGLFFCISQVFLTYYTYTREQTRMAFYSSNANNILYGTVILKRMFALGVPMATLLIKCLTIRPLERFCEKTGAMDKFLNSPHRRVDVGFDCLEEETKHKIRRVNFLSGLGVILCEVLNLCVAIGYSVFGRGQGVPPWYTLYFYHSFLSMHFCIALNIYTQFYALTLRQDLFTAFVQTVADLQGTGRQRERRRQRLNKVFGVGNGRKGKMKTVVRL